MGETRSSSKAAFVIYGLVSQAAVALKCCKKNNVKAFCLPETGECTLNCDRHYTTCRNRSYCFAAIRYDNKTKLSKKGHVVVNAYATCVEEQTAIKEMYETTPTTCNSTTSWSDCYCRKNGCNSKVTLTETDRLKEARDRLRLYLTPRQKKIVQNETARQLEQPSVIITGNPGGIILPNPGLMIAAVLISMSIACLFILLLAYAYFRLAKIFGWHPSLMRRYTIDYNDSSLGVNRHDELLSYPREEAKLDENDSYDMDGNSDSRDSGLPPTVFQDSSVANTSESRSLYTLSSQGLSDVQFDSVIGQGRFSTVWKVKCPSYEISEVCVKEFHASESSSWRQEKAVLASPLYQSKHVIKLLSSELRTDNGKKKMWLVLPYYQCGDLQQFLKRNELDLEMMLRISHSVALAVEFIHSEKDSFGCLRLPLAHRDIKSSNILVCDSKVDVVLADFGLSMRLSKDMTKTYSSIGQAGTSRYMSPELLDRYSDIEKPEAYKQVDIYALALVLWEILNKTTVDESMQKPEYSAPYAHLVSDQPSKDVMRSIVVSKGLRPNIRPTWFQNRTTRVMTNLIEESWDKDPEARLTAATILTRIKKCATEQNITLQTT